MLFIYQIPNTEHSVRNKGTTLKLSDAGKSESIVSTSSYKETTYTDGITKVPTGQLSFYKKSYTPFTLINAPLTPSTYDRVQSYFCLLVVTIEREMQSEHHTTGDVISIISMFFRIHSCGISF